AGLAALNVLSAVQRHVRPRHDDDFVDRLHYVMAPAVLLSFAGLHGLKQYFGKPIECWPPAEMVRKQWLNYIHGFCFVEDTYFVGFNEHFPIRRVDHDQRQLHYYQWIPFVLMSQVLLLILPKMLWFLFIQKNGFSFSYFLNRLVRVQKEDGKAISREIEATKQIAVRLARDRRDRLCFRKELAINLDLATPTEDGVQSLHKTFFWSEFVWRLDDQKLTLGYLAFKVANLAIVVLQLHLLNSYFGADAGYSLWGLNMLRDLTAGRDWRESGLFPRIAFCDLQIRPPQREMQPVRYTFQCLLNMNMINEKIFLFIWFALLALAVVGSFNLALWLYRCLSWRPAEQFIRDELLKLRKDSEISKESDNFRGFVRDSLGRDTVTFLHIVKANCLPLTSAKMIGQLWHYHKKGPIKIATKKFSN
uniref:Innexin n=1 Tax=Globodera pallida TaxID=36090 RepID=A0A183CGN3_GLOPA